MQIMWMEERIMEACSEDLYGGRGGTEEIVRILKDDGSGEGWMKRLQERRSGDRKDEGREEGNGGKRHV